MAARFGVDRRRDALWLAGGALAVALAFVVYSFVGTFVFGLFVYYATRPLYRWFRQHVRPPTLAAAVSLTLIALPALLLLVYTLAVGVQEANRFIASGEVSLGPLEEFVRSYVDISKVAQDPRALLEEPNVQAVLLNTVDQALSYLGFIGTGALHLFVMIGIAFYLLRDGHRLRHWFERRIALGDDVVVTYARAVDRDFSNIFFGNILNAVLTGLIGALVYNGLAVLAPANVPLPYPTLVGLLAGVASLVPVVGMKLVYVPVAGYLTAVALTAAPRLLWFPAVFAVVSFVVVDTIPDLVLRPYVSGRGLHLGMVMFAYIFGPLLFGWYGIFLGPMLLVLVVHFVRIVLPELVHDDEDAPALADRIDDLAVVPASQDGAGEATVAGDPTGDDGPPADDAESEAGADPDGEPDDADTRPS
ncbi:MAG: AI-2E family transporter [Halobacteriaceae archaeon]